MENLEKLMTDSKLWDFENFSNFLKEEPNLLPVINEILPDQHFVNCKYEFTDSDAPSIWCEDADGNRSEIILLIGENNVYAHNIMKSITHNVGVDVMQKDKDYSTYYVLICKEKFYPESDEKIIESAWKSNDNNPDLNDLFGKEHTVIVNGLD